ncbi:MAG: hypothetical protein CMI36_09720 [Owenweeksia sp.]|nr:hypothetical protein [Owenweeksia sp.]MBF99260.1 hypothetical protein [Owenweeksia sp.]HBF22096.1 hypothetical protein [Cryomorphaceae bacterium]
MQVFVPIRVMRSVGTVLSSDNSNIDKVLEIKDITRKRGFIPGEGTFFNSEDVKSIFSEIGFI